MGLSENLKDIKERIAKAAADSGRAASDITLVAVTKTIDAQRIDEVARLGVLDLGENRPQEMLSKQPLIEAARWHMIGHLQTNKVKSVIGKTVLIHSVDSQRLAAEISKQAQTCGIVQDILIEVNIGYEESKHGVCPEDALKLAQSATALSGVRLKGLMTVAPFIENPQNTAVYFINMRKLLVDISNELQHNGHAPLEHLSMGMTHDFEAAIKEGATIVRIGTGIFGER